MESEMIKLISAAALSLGLAVSAQAATVDFEGGATPVIVGGLSTPTEGYSARGFGATFLRSSNALQLTFVNFAASAVSIAFDLAIIDSWDGIGGSPGPDQLHVSVNGTEVLSPVFANASGIDQISAADAGKIDETFGAANIGFSFWNDRSFHVNLGTLSHVAGTDLVIFFSLPGAQGLTDESFAVDNITLNVPAVPVPASLPLLLAGFGALGMLRRRR
jgi:hypothetical protein